MSRSLDLFLFFRGKTYIILKKQGGLLLEELCAECETSAKDKLLEIVRREKLLQFAAAARSIEFLVVVIHNLLISYGTWTESGPFSILQFF